MKGIYRYLLIFFKYISIFIFYQVVIFKDGVYFVQIGVFVDDVKQKIISEIDDMFIIVKRVYFSFFFVCCFLFSFVVEQFKDLEKEGFGKVVVINCFIVFFKKVLEYFINEEYKFGKYNIFFDIYKELF